MVYKINTVDSPKHEEKKTLCAVRNPSERSNQSWFYNIFLGHTSKNKGKRNHTKVNWVMKLTENEIKLLKEKTCKIIELEPLQKNKKQVLGDLP